MTNIMTLVSVFTTTSNNLIYEDVSLACICADVSMVILGNPGREGALRWMWQLDGPRPWKLPFPPGARSEECDPVLFLLPHIYLRNAG